VRVLFAERPEFYDCDPDKETQSTMKNTYRQGGAQSLNLYLCSPGLNAIGSATLPDENSYMAKRDGVMILSDTLPGSRPSAFNLGDTTVHEVGHWFGLSHTFEGGEWILSLWCFFPR
jgi:hypothetical protein